VPVISADFLPTLLELAGEKRPAGHQVDGKSLVLLWRGSGDLKRDALFWHYPHYHPGGATPYSAIRQGDWKLIEFFDENRVELYDLKQDIGEKADLAARQPEKRDQLLGKLRRWREEVGAQMPLSNPDYDPPTDRYFNPPAHLKQSRGE
jgi:arylsulfatase A